MSVIDVLGAPIRPDADLILHHEHLRIDLACWVDPLPGLDARTTVTAETLPEVRANPWAFFDNMRLDGDDLIDAELALVPGTSLVVVDVTPVDVGRDPGALRALAERTNVQVVMGCGHYVESARADELPRPPEAYRDEILHDLTVGIDGVRAGVIGEIGTSTPITPLETATLRGAAMAQATSGAPLLIHVDLWNPSAVEALDLAIAAGADPTRTVLCHADCSLLVRDVGYYTGLLRRGACLGFDTWGDELRYGDGQQPSDARRLEVLDALAGEGFAAQILHSHDICTKTQLRRFGGPGYAHIADTLFPRLAAAGWSPAELDAVFVAPARRLLG